MKKYIIGMLFGFTLAFTVSAHADFGSLIGKTIQGEFPVTVDNVKLDKTAVVIDGTSYLPVRAIGNATGYDITFNSDLGVVLKKSEVVKKMSTTSTTLTDSEIAKQQEDVMNQKIVNRNAENDRLSKLKINAILLLNNKKSEIAKYQQQVDQNALATDDINKKLFYPDSDFATWYKQFTDALTKAQSELADLQTQYDNIQSQIDALDAPTPSPTPTP